MVYVNNKKFACESCIKGHRSSSCTHTDRPLFEVKKKGRPISQCEKCRELRQSRRVHSKCTCNEKATPSPRGPPQASSSGTKSNRRFVPIEPALPNGLKDVFQASQRSVPTPADIRQRVETLLNPCNCSSRNARKCQCAKQESTNDHVPKGSTEPRLLTLARAAVMCCSPGNTADSSSSTSGKQAETSKRLASRPTTPHAPSRKRPKSNYTHTPVGLELPPIFSSSTSVSPPIDVPSFPAIPPLSAVASLAGSGCTCGLYCACPDCEEHRGPRSSAQRCGNGCNHCVDPTLTSLPGSTGKSIIDQFFARAAALPVPPSSRKSGSGVSLDPMNTTIYPSAAHGTDERSAAFGLVNLPKLECCGGNCGCPSGKCGCGQACDGCCSKHGGESPGGNLRSSSQNASAFIEEVAKVPDTAQLVRSCCSGR